MFMEIKSIIKQADWDSWLQKACLCASFAQSWAWGEILRSEGRSIERLALVDGERILMAAQVVYQDLSSSWRYAFCPSGPVIDKPANQSLVNVGWAKLWVDHFVNQHCIFWRIEPKVLPTNSGYLLQPSIDITPRSTLRLDLSQPEAELLSKMHSKTRYNINLAGRKKLILNDAKDIGALMRLMKQTGERDKFRLHAEEHYRQVLSAPVTYQLTAHQISGATRDAVSVAVFIGFGNTFTYLYGASNYQQRDLMAPYLLQWEGIKLGKKLGYKWYDFFGVAPIGSKNHFDCRYDTKHQYAGVTRFKLGFGGQYNEHPGTHDLIISPAKYKMYQILRQARRLFRALSNL